MYKILGFLLLMIGVLPSMIWAQDNASIAVDGFPRGVTSQELRDASIFEDRLDLIRQSILTDLQDLATATKAGDRPKIKAVKEQLARDWRNYRVQRSRLKKITGFDYQNTKNTKHQSIVDEPPPVVTLRVLIDMRKIKDKLNLIKQSIITDRDTLDNVTNTGDDKKIKAVQDVLAQDFRNYKQEKTALKALEAQINPNTGGPKKEGHKHKI